MAAPVSYAERARRAQNIRSPIAAPPPNISPARLASNNSNASATSVTSVASAAPSSGAVSTSFSVTTDDSSIVFATREPSLTPPPKSQPAPANVAASAARSPSPQLAAKALSIVAAHTAPSLGSGKVAPTVNVWSQRIERMAAARAAAVATVPAGPTQSANVESLTPANGNGNGKATGDQLRDAGEQQPSAPGVVGTAKSISTSTSTSVVQATAASAPNLVSKSAPVLPLPSSVEALGEQQAVREGVSADAWPEVGKSVLAAASGDSLRPSESTSTMPEEAADDDQEKGAFFAVNFSFFLRLVITLPVRALDLNLRANRPSLFCHFLALKKYFYSATWPPRFPYHRVSSLAILDGEDLARVNFRDQSVSIIFPQCFEILQNSFSEIFSTWLLSSSQLHNDILTLRLSIDYMLTSLCIQASKVTLKARPNRNGSQYPPQSCKPPLTRP